MWYLFWCANEHNLIRLPEFESICRLLNVNYKWVTRNCLEPWVMLDLESDSDAKIILSRSISTKFAIRLWAQGSTYTEFHTNLRQFPFDDNSSLLSDCNSYKINVDTFTKKINLQSKIDKIESMDYLPIKGKIDLEDPDVEYSYLEFWGLDGNDIPPHPCNIFFGPVIGRGQRSLIQKHSLKTRKFIGNTTMDPQLSLLMANLGLVKEGSFVLDPFVGTASLLLASAQFKGVVFGGDIDYLTLHARTRPSRVNQKVRAADESIIQNFIDYELSHCFGDVIACDFSKSPWRSSVELDLIITDPPYGMREQMTRVGTEKDYTVESIPDKYLKNHIPEKVSYSLKNILEDLLNFSAQRLCLGGRLVYWLPIIRQTYKDEFLPSHPCLNLLYNCEQILTTSTSRRLIVMEKTKKSQGLANVPEEITNFKDQCFEPVPVHLSKKKRKKCLRNFGHLNITKEELEAKNCENGTPTEA